MKLIVKGSICLNSHFKQGPIEIHLKGSQDIDFQRATCNSNIFYVTLFSTLQWSLDGRNKLQGLFFLS